MLLSSLYASEEKGASKGMHDVGFLEPESNVYNFLSKPTLAIICKGIRIRRHQLLRCIDQNWKSNYINTKQDLSSPHVYLNIPNHIHVNK